MAVYSELIKNFERIRKYMREFYVFGFKSRTEYSHKSARSYDDERRRMESWLGEHMRFVRTAEGKNLFLSIDSRDTACNPLYRAWKAKSFTDGDVTLHFCLFDLLQTPMTLPQILKSLDGEYLCYFDSPMLFDESTVRKKLREYVQCGIIHAEKRGKAVVYSRAESVPVPKDTDALHFFSEVSPVGVIGSFLLDRAGSCGGHFAFKHHYITHALDSEVLALLFDAMQEKREVTVTNLARRASDARECRVVPLKVFISVQNGRQHLLAYCKKEKCIKSYRLDYLRDVKPGEVCGEFGLLREKLRAIQRHMWGVNCHTGGHGPEHVEFTVRVDEGEEYIVQRLYREKRCGTVEKIDDRHYRFTAEVYDTGEVHPWIRTFFCRITKLNFSNRTIENQFKRDLQEMYRMYGVTDHDLS